MGRRKAVISHLAALNELGITVVEIMPVAQFPGGRNWGYDGVYPFEPQNTCGGPEGLKHVVDAWRTALSQWSRTNAGHRKRIAGGHAPDRNDEHLLYQTLLGVWTAAAQGKARDEAHDELIARISTYIAKATKEAKLQTSWMNPNEDCDRALSKFVSAILKPGSHLRFLNKAAPLLQRVAYYGQFSALAQLLLKLTAPGVTSGWSCRRN
jgi:maltooligosyltrehalose synthase